MIKRIILTTGILLCSFTAASAKDLSATVSWADKRELSAPITTLVKKVSVSPGSIVKKGALLVELDCGQQRSKLREQLALARGLEPSVEKAFKDKELADELFERTVLSEIEHREAELKYIEKKSQYDAVVASSKQYEWTVNHCKLVADSDLVVLDVHKSSGELFNIEAENKSLLSVASATAMTVIASEKLPLKEKLFPGKKIKAQLKGKTYNGVIKAIRFKSEIIEVAVQIPYFNIQSIGDNDAKLILP